MPTISNKNETAVRCFHRFLSDLEYADYVVLLTEDPNKMQVFLDLLNCSEGMFGIGFAPLKCKMLLQICTEWMLKLVPLKEQLNQVERFSCLVI